MKRKFLISTIFIVSVLIFIASVVIKQEEKFKIQKMKEKEKHLITLKEKYQPYVKTLKNAKLYQKDGETYQEKGLLSTLWELSLEQDFIYDENTLYFPLKDLPYYISYQDIEPIENMTLVDQRYKNYIPFDYNIVTDNKTTFYQDNQVVLEISEGINLPLIINDDDYYYVEYANHLLGIKKDEAKQVEHHNSDLEKATAIATLNYHFFYNDTSEACNQSICIHTDLFKAHLDYLKNNNFYDMKMRDMELFVEGKINLPKKSVLITIDDGWLSDLGRQVLTEYKMHATMFLITLTYEMEWFENEYIEVHSHSDNLHYTGECSGGQGGPIRCLPREMILADLKTTREKLKQTTYFCYPFYEYNQYAVDLLKEAGFTMAFIGGGRKVKIGDNKMLLPRYAIQNYTSVNALANMVN